MDLVKGIILFDQYDTSDCHLHFLYYQCENPSIIVRLHDQGASTNIIIQNIKGGVHICRVANGDLTWSVWRRFQVEIWMKHFENFCHQNLLSRSSKCRT